MKLDVRNARKIGGTIQRRRKRLGLTQAQAAEKAQVGDAYFGRIERGERAPSMAKLFEIAGALETSPSDLLADCRPGPDRDRIRQKITDLLDQVKDLIDQL